jgi:hypothetical protein
VILLVCKARGNEGALEDAPENGRKNKYNTANADTTMIRTDVGRRADEGIFEYEGVLISTNTRDTCHSTPATTTTYFCNQKNPLNFGH